MYMQIPQMQENPLPTCPRCGKQALVKSTNDDIYSCLNCSFRKDLNTSYWDSSSLFGAFALLALVSVIAFSLLNINMSIGQRREDLPSDNQTSEIKSQSSFQKYNNRSEPNGSKKTVSLGE